MTSRGGWRHQGIRIWNQRCGAEPQAAEIQVDAAWRRPQGRLEDRFLEGQSLPPRMEGGRRAGGGLVCTQLSLLEVWTCRWGSARLHGAASVRDRRRGGTALVRNYAPRPRRPGTRGETAEFLVPQRVKKKIQEPEKDKQEPSCTGGPPPPTHTHARARACAASADTLQQ